MARSVLGSIPPLLVYRTDGAGQKLGFDRYQVYVNGSLVGNYDTYGSDQAPRSVERWLMAGGTIPAELRVVGNSIHLLCDDDLDSQAIQHLRLRLSLG